MVIKRLLVSSLWLFSAITSFYPAEDEYCAMDCCVSVEVCCSTDSQAACPTMAASKTVRHITSTPAPGGPNLGHGYLATLQVAPAWSQPLDSPPAVALDHPVHIPAPHFSLLI